MKKKIKIIDLLCLISVGEEVPNRIMYNEVVWEYEKNLYDYRSRHSAELLFSDEIVPNWVITHLNTEVEILEEILDEEDKDIPLIPDDELWEIDGKKGIVEDIGEIARDNAINYNFKVLKEKINQLVEEFNEYRKGE